MAEFWGVITTTTEGYDSFDSRAGGIRRRHTKIVGASVGARATPVAVVINPIHLAWQTRAACFGMDRDLFFDDDDVHVERLRPVCNSCPVRQICDDYAEANQLVGFWGGRTETERRRERARRLQWARREAKKAGA